LQDACLRIEAGAQEARARGESGALHSLQSVFNDPTAEPLQRFAAAMVALRDNNQHSHLRTADVDRLFSFINRSMQMQGLYATTTKLGSIVSDVYALRSA